MHLDYLCNNQVTIHRIYQAHFALNLRISELYPPNPAVRRRAPVVLLIFFGQLLRNISPFSLYFFRIDNHTQLILFILHLVIQIRFYANRVLCFYIGDVIIHNIFIPGYQCKTLHHGLCDEHSVKWISMIFCE